MTKTLAVVPARAGSKRVPGKNFRLFLGKPLVQWTLEFAKSYKGFSEIIVSTDCDEVAQISSGLGVDVPWRRPSELASDHSGTVDVILHALDMLEKQGKHFDRVAVLQVTTPFRVGTRWDAAHNLLDLGAPAAVGVKAVENHPYWTYWLGKDGEMQPCFPSKSVKRSQDLPPAGVLNGALYLCLTDVLKKTRSLVPDGVKAVYFDRVIESIDIDTEQDWIMAEELFAQANVKNPVE